MCRFFPMQGDRDDGKFTDHGLAGPGLPRQHLISLGSIKLKVAHLLKQSEFPFYMSELLTLRFRTSQKAADDS